MPIWKPDACAAALYASQIKPELPESGCSEPGPRWRSTQSVLRTASPLKPQERCRQKGNSWPALRATVLAGFGRQVNGQRCNSAQRGPCCCQSAGALVPLLGHRGVHPAFERWARWIAMSYLLPFPGLASVLRS